MKFSAKPLVVVLAMAVAGLYLAKDAVARAACAGAVKAITGLQLEIARMHVGLAETKVGIEGMRLYNPRGFSERVMADIPELVVDYRLGAFLQGKIHLEEARLHLRELVVEKNPHGELNLNALRTVKAQQEEGAAPTGRPSRERRRLPPLHIDRLRLQIGRVVYKDYSQTPPQITAYEVNLKEEYKNITDPSSLVSVIVVRALAKTAVARLANFDVGLLKGEASEVLRQATQWFGSTAESSQELGTKAVEATKEAAREASEALKRFIYGTE